MTIFVCYITCFWLWPSWSWSTPALWLTPTWHYQSNYQQVFKNAAIHWRADVAPQWDILWLFAIMCTSEWFHAVGVVELFVSNDFTMFIKVSGGGGCLSPVGRVCYLYLSVILSGVDKIILLTPSHHYYYHLTFVAVTLQHLFLPFSY